MGRCFLAASQDANCSKNSLDWCPSFRLAYLRSLRDTELGNDILRFNSQAASTLKKAKPALTLLRSFESVAYGCMLDYQFSQSCFNATRKVCADAVDHCPGEGPNGSISPF